MIFVKTFKQARLVVPITLLCLLYLWCLWQISCLTRPLTSSCWSLAPTQTRRQRSGRTWKRKEDWKRWQLWLQSIKAKKLTSSPIITMAWEVTTPSSEESTWSFPPNLDKDVAVWVTDYYKHRKNHETALTSGIPSSMYVFPVKCNKQSRFRWESQFETCDRVGDPRPICFHLNSHKHRKNITNHKTKKCDTICNL